MPGILRVGGGAWRCAKLWDSAAHDLEGGDPRRLGPGRDAAATWISRKHLSLGKGRVGGDQCGQVPEGSLRYFSLGWCVRGKFPRKQIPST